MKSPGFAGMVISGLAVVAIGLASPATAQPTPVGDPPGHHHHSWVVNVIEASPHVSGHGLAKPVPPSRSAQQG